MRFVTECISAFSTNKDLYVFDTAHYVYEVSNQLIIKFHQCMMSTTHLPHPALAQPLILSRSRLPSYRALFDRASTPHPQSTHTLFSLPFHTNPSAENISPPVYRDPCSCLHKPFPAPLYRHLQILTTSTNFRHRTPHHYTHQTNHTNHNHAPHLIHLNLHPDRRPSLPPPPNSRPHLDTLIPNPPLRPSLPSRTPNTKVQPLLLLQRQVNDDQHPPGQLRPR